MKKDRIEQVRIEQMRKIQNDIEYYSWLQEGLTQSLDYILKKLAELDWVDGGGIYLHDDKNKVLQLVRHFGLPHRFVNPVVVLDSKTIQYHLLQEKKAIYNNLAGIHEAGLMDVIEEGLTFLAVLPLLHQNQLIGSLNLASRKVNDINTADKFLLESVATRIGTMIAYIKAKDELQNTLESLDHKVRIRTKKLDQLNQKLKNEIAVHEETKRALETSANLYRSIFNNAQDGIVLYDAVTFKIVDLNSRAHFDLGYTREEFLKLEPLDFTIYEYEGQRKEIIEKLIQDRNVHYNIRHKSKNGEIKFRVINASIIETGEDRYILGLVHDITSLVETENILEKTKRDIQRMTESINIGIFRFDSKGYPVFMNNYARNLLGIGLSDNLAEFSFDQFGLKTGQIIRLLKMLGDFGELKNHEVWINRIGGSGFLGSINLRFFYPDEDEHNTWFVDGTIDDVTALRQAQKELEMANQLITSINDSLKQRIDDALKVQESQQAMILQKSKLESLGELAAGIAHEINQPVGIISLALENLKARFESGEITPNYLKSKFENVNEHINRIRKIIENIRIFSRDQGYLVLEKVFINRIVKKAVSLIKTQYQANNIKLELNLTDQNEFTVGSRVKLEQVVYNLLSNAKYAVEEKEILTREAGYVKTIQITSGVEGNNKLFLEVTDNGVGIPKENLTRVFDPFFSTKSEFKGTGLGLSVVFGIIHDMKGVIKVESAVGQFTKFRIILPMFPEKD